LSWNPSLFSKEVFFDDRMNPLEIDELIFTEITRSLLVLKAWTRQLEVSGFFKVLQVYWNLHTSVV